MKHDPLEEILGITRGPPTRRLGNDGHRITATAWSELLAHYQCTSEKLTTLLTTELNRVMPVACVAYQQHYVLCTNYEFGAKTDQETLWYVPNDQGGITITLPGEAPR